MSELISGKEALIALANGDEVERSPISLKDADEKYWTSENVNNFTINDFLGTHWIFRLKPRTITLNGIEVPTPFDSSLKHKQYAYALNTASPDGYSSMKFYDGGSQPLICWTDEEEIKQVVAALRSVFKGE